MNEEYRKEVEALIGKTITTVYGPSEVVGLQVRNGITYINLLERGDEPYNVELEQWRFLTGGQVVSS